MVGAQSKGPACAPRIRKVEASCGRLGAADGVLERRGCIFRSGVGAVPLKGRPCVEGTRPLTSWARAMALPTARSLHDKLWYALALPLLVSAGTGAVWTVQKFWLGMPKPSGWLMKWHQGDQYFGVLAPASSTYYVADGPWPGLPLTKSWRYPYLWFVAVAAMLVFVTGLTMMERPGSKKLASQRGCRFAHHVLALTLSWPLLFTVGTGVAYRLLSLHGIKLKWLRQLHTGYFGALQPILPLLMCSVAVALYATGFNMSPSVRQARRALKTFGTSSKSG